MTTFPLDRLAERASTEPFFLGSRLKAFAARERLDDPALAARLGCAVPVLAQVRLCRAPRLDSSAAYREDVTAIATKFGLNTVALAEAAKAVPVEALARPGATEPAGAVLAARDRGTTS
ncbi:hypothetical protein GobsT_67190 [Gemmata obscuriglobus]|uniref:Uncharacterized protein n=1 Tax=Gemmata obscuriglobus TaxID=114 RepID=A0A2Z3GXE3_9BACT|nr:hypothetical protein [Gemmata obscuriglobus]AWM35605.1 hypothetical protein C1280_00240 [Gemmata obscuriglobus]QEG31872.1 hypothetical protein GobsT_67190 [Gemmata obscuriglobus]VTS11218.1 unnamed protein product [Gemmata obscuriglobus UQM 2246]